VLTKARRKVVSSGPRVHQVQLLSFRKLGEEKYAALGM
jgi:hypothetical protein